MQINYDEFVLVSNEIEDKNCHTVKEKRGMKNSQRDDVEKDRLIEHVKRIRIDKIVKQSDKINLSHKNEL